MKPIRSLLLVAAILGWSGSHAQVKEENAGGGREEAAPNLPAGELTPKLLYRFLLAEIAGQRGQLGQAAETYLELSRETRDPRIARRATELALHARRGETALQAVKLWLEVDPKSSQARQTHISLLAAQGHFVELQTLLAGMLAAEPDRINQNLLHLNRLFARSQDRKAAHAAVDVLTTPYLQHPEAHYARAVAAYEMRDIPLARTSIQQALSLKPDWENAVLFHAQIIENRSEAADVLRTFVDANPLAREARLAFARALVGDKRYPEARREFGKLLEQGAGDPAKNGDAIFAVAILSMQLGDAQDAEKYLRQLIDIGHGEADKARYYLGQIAAETKRWDDAYKWFLQVGRGEHYLSSRLHAANALAKQGKVDEAARHLADTEAGDPRERAQLAIGEAQLLREAGRITAAHAALVRALVQQPEHPELIYEAALLAEKLGRNDELETRLRRLIELKPDHAHAHNALGYSFAERNIRLDEARKLIQRALELAPNDPFILDSKGWILFRQGDKTAALEALKMAFGIRADPEIAAHLGEVLWALDRRDEARATWEKARGEHPGNEVLADTIKRFLP